MGYIENPYKVQNIVNAQLDLFKEKYGQIVKDLENLNLNPDGQLEQDMNLKTRGRLIQSLPTNFRAKVKHLYLWELSKDGNFNVSREDVDLMQQLSDHPRLNMIITKGFMLLILAITQVVARPAMTQSIKGIVTAGFGKSMKYVAEKFNKRQNAKPPTT